MNALSPLTALLNVFTYLIYVNRCAISSAATFHVLNNISSVVSRAKLYILSRRTNGGMFSAALPRLILRMRSFADFFQTNGLGWTLWCAMYS